VKDVSENYFKTIAGTLGSAGPVPANEAPAREPAPLRDDPEELHANALLDDVAAFVRRFVVLDERQADAIALWVAHTHAAEAAETTPYILFTSAEKRSGKTRALEVLELLVHVPLPTANISDAALFRAIAELGPTLLLDEVDAIFGSKARDREDLRGLLNAGYRRGAVARRMGGARMTTLEAFPVYCPKAFAAIGKLPDTIADRSISIRLERKTREEHVERFRRRQALPAGEILRDRLADCLQPQLDYLREATPDLPDELDDRAQDCWESLLAIADLAGGDWPKRARSAALELSGNGEREDDSLTARLLKDIYSVFENGAGDRLRTADLITHLSEIEESPWGDWYGKPISAQKLSGLLQPHRIRTMPVWVDGKTVKGYKVEQFADAFHRVLGVRAVRGVRSRSASETAPNRPNPPNPPDAEGSDDRPLLGDEGYDLALADAARDGLITKYEFDETLAVHRLVERARAEALR
jgi:Protein of unknown function (DUF3631)